MKKVKVFADNQARDLVMHIEEYMREKPSSLSVLIIKQGISLDDIENFDWPDDLVGKVVTIRSRLFFFWLKEYLVEHKLSIGTYYAWYKESSITHLKQETL